jgi:hypothetical protein
MSTSRSASSRPHVSTRLTVARDRHRRHLALVVQVLQLARALALLRRPEAQRAVEVARHQREAVARQRHGVARREAEHGAHAVALLQVPQLERAVVAARGDAAAVVREGDREHFADVAGERVPLDAALDAPEARRVVVARAEHKLAARRERHRHHRLHRTGERAVVRAGARVPEFDGLVAARGGEHGADRVERDARDLAAVATSPTCAAAVGGVATRRCEQRDWASAGRRATARRRRGDRARWRRRPF